MIFELLISLFKRTDVLDVSKLDHISRKCHNLNFTDHPQHPKEETLFHLVITFANCLHPGQAQQYGLLENFNAKILSFGYVLDIELQPHPRHRPWLVGWFCCFTSQVNIYGHCGTVSSPNHTFSWADLNKPLTSNLCTYFRL